ncbi:hypothetical protein [Streptomyces lonarensis]|uniref:Uncharacterized protein n=1 Tax=Streptomyces lonarensis TaxID=700599 RepID=A0A7X6HX33_9ACTN|nr:hypothetical protein [Streptomyces lonarensis]NJQ04108.1 hypothetical protein [Streptomyces lonarensis]
MNDAPRALRPEANWPAAFPTRLAGDVARVLEAVPPDRYPANQSFTVDVRGEVLVVPERFNADEPGPAALQALTPSERLVLHCLYTRHGDGYVRQRHVEQILTSDEPCVVPYVIRLVGEYVLEIVEAIGRGLPGLATPGSPQRRLYGEFIASNPAFFARTERRVVSYWSCYYRWRHPSFDTYPGGILLATLRACAEEQTGRPLPHHTPLTRSSRAN